MIFIRNTGRQEEEISKESRKAGKELWEGIVL
jgi:hypothetical protein